MGEENVVQVRKQLLVCRQNSKVGVAQRQGNPSVPKGRRQRKMVFSGQVVRVEDQHRGLRREGLQHLIGQPGETGLHKKQARLDFDGAPSQKGRQLIRASSAGGLARGSVALARQPVANDVLFRVKQRYSEKKAIFA